MLKYIFKFKCHYYNVNVDGGEWKHREIIIEAVSGEEAFKIFDRQFDQRDVKDLMQIPVLDFPGYQDAMALCLLKHHSQQFTLKGKKLQKIYDLYQLGQARLWKEYFGDTSPWEAVRTGTFNNISGLQEYNWQALWSEEKINLIKAELDLPDFDFGKYYETGYSNIQQTEEQESLAV